MSNVPPVATTSTSTTSFFEGYYNRSLPIDPTVYDIIVTFFLTKTNGDRTAAEALTASVMVLAQNKGVDPMAILSQFQNLSSSTAFKAALLALLNTDRRPTSKLGYATVPSQNTYVTRNISK